MVPSANFIKKLIYDISNGINVCKIGQITAINKLKSTISVKPLHSAVINGKKTDLPILVNVPLLQFMTTDFIIKLPVDVGDKVLIIHVDYDIENLVISGEQKDENVDSIHDINSAIAIPFNLSSLNSELSINDSDDLYIGTKSGNTYIKIQPTGEIIIDSTSNVYFGEGSTDGLALGTSLKSWLDTHVHSDPQGGNTGAPTSGSPNPSSKFFVE